MAARTISGTLPTFPRATIRFRQQAAFVTASATYLAREYPAGTDDTGAFTVALPVPDSGTVPYRIELPDATAVEVSLGAGSATTLELLLAGAFAASGNPDVLAVLQSLLTAHAALRASTTVFGHAAVDGTTITSSGGVLSSSAGGGAPSGPAGGVLSGTYPNPSFAADMATQAELDAAQALDLKIASNLSDLNSAATARGNLGLGSAAVTNTGTGAANTILGNDARLTDSRTPTTHSHPESDVTSLVADLALKAPLASPTFTGVPAAPTPVDATSSTQIATTAFVHSLITALINASPATLDTLKELADAIGDDPNFATTVASSIATKLAKSANLSDLTDPSAARTNLVLGALATLSSITASLISDASANGRSLITAANYAAMKALLNLVVGTDVQAFDADLTTIAGLTATTDNFIVSVASAWASRTPAQVKTTLGLLALAFKATVATADIDNDAVTYAKMQNVSATSRILGRTTAGAGDVEELTGAQALAITGAGQAISVNVFTSTTLTWPIPAGVTELYLEVIGAGGGGGSGRRGAAGSARGGGGGAGSGGRSWRVMRRSDIASTLDITVGAAGTGGAAVSADSTNGTNGVGGGTCSIAITSGATLVTANGGGLGFGGTTSGGTAGGSVSGMEPGNVGGAGATGTGAGANQSGTAYPGMTAGGGGGGGGITAGDVIADGGVGGISRSWLTTGATGGVNPGGAGNPGTANPGQGPGGGGAGGASSKTGVAGTGGAGGNYGAGGGGGGASLDGNNSGAGGAGGAGVCVIICW